MGNLTFPILRLLADGRFRSGEAIARHFKVSRTSIWNALQEAETLGVEIFSVRGKGYRLPEQITLLDKNIILNQFHYLQQCKLQQCKQQNVAVDLQIHDQLESTNGFLMELPVRALSMPPVSRQTCKRRGAADVDASGRPDWAPA